MGVRYLANLQYLPLLLTLQLLLFLFPSTVCEGRSLPFLPLDLLEQEASLLWCVCVSHLAI